MIEAHELKPEWLEHVHRYEIEITEHLKKKVDYAKIEVENLSEEELMVARLFQ